MKLPRAPRTRRRKTQAPLTADEYNDYKARELAWVIGGSSWRSPRLRIVGIHYDARG